MAEETEHSGAHETPDAAASDAGQASAPGEPTPLPDTAAGLAIKAKDLQALRDAVVETQRPSGRACGLAISLFCSTFSSPLAA
jgi:hypothetical protein